MHRQDNNTSKIHGIQKMKSEAHLENYAKEVFRKECGAFTMKLDPVHNSGVPDMLICHKGLAFFIEFKTPRGHVSEHQKNYHRNLQRHGFDVLVVRTPEQVLEFAEMLKML